MHKVKADLAEQAAEAKRKDLNMSVEQWKYKFLYPFGNIAPIPSDKKSHPQNAKGIRDSLNSLISNTMNDAPYGNTDGGI